MIINLDFLCSCRKVFAFYITTHLSNIKYKLFKPLTQFPKHIFWRGKICEGCYFIAEIEYSIGIFPSNPLI
jgi:hypothetical protein